MPREKEGIERIEFELPTEIAARLREEAPSRRIGQLIARILANHYGIEYEAPALGRPKKVVVTPKKRARKAATPRG